MSSILQPLIDRLRSAGPARWEAIALAAGVAKSLPRKLVYGDRDNPTVQTIQPLVDFFAAVDNGDIELPAPALPPSADPVKQMRTTSRQPAAMPPAAVDEERRDPARVNPFPDLDRRAASVGG